MFKSNKLFANLYLIIIIAVYFFSRLYFYLVLNIDFSYTFKDNLIQYLDVELLRSQLWTSIFYLHSQPPLFNLLIGMNEIIFGNFASIIFLVLFNIMGVFTAILAFNTLTKLGLSKKLATFLIIFYVLSPATILYENLFFYTHPIIFFLVFSAYHLVVYLQNQKFVNAFFFFFGMALAVYTTSFFHLIWFFGFGLFVFIREKTNRASLIRASAIPFMMVLALYLKNFIIFGQINTSSWLGLNLSRITVHQLDNKEKIELINKGYLTDLSAFAPFTHFEDLDTLVIKYFTSQTGIEVLDQTVKQNGRTNYNNYGYLIISQKMLKDDLYVMKNYPKVYLSGIINSFVKYFDSPTKYKLLTLNAFRIESYNKLFDAFIYGSSRNTQIGYTSFVVIIIILFGAIYLFFMPVQDRVVKTFIGFVLFNILYVMFVGNLLEYGENNRFRYYTELFYVLLLGLLISELFFKKKFMNNPDLIPKKK